jgi:FkbM family methyltransferase
MEIEVGGRLLSVFDEGSLNDSYFHDRYGFDCLQCQYKVYLDIGASEGLVYLRNKSRFDEAYLIEPHLSSFSNMTRNIKDEKGVHLLNLGLSNSRHIGNSTLFFDNEWKEHDSNKAMFIRGDDLGIKPDCIKIDSNNGHIDILQSLAGTIDSNKPHIYLAKYKDMGLDDIRKLLVGYVLIHDTCPQQAEHGGLVFIAP